MRSIFANMTLSSTQTRSEPLVCPIVYDGLCTFEFGITVELFGLPRPEFDQWYRFAPVGVAPGPVRAVGGVTVEAAHGLAHLDEASLIIVPGWCGIEAPVPDDLCARLRCAYEKGARIASICSGVFVLAAAGLLHGRRATTHWRYADCLVERYPSVQVDRDVLFVEDDRVFTSAGSAAGLDLGLHIIRQDHGARVAASGAKRLVLPAQRDGGQQQFIPKPEPQQRGGMTLTTLQERVLRTLNEHWPVERMAEMAGVSARTLARRFDQELRATPAGWLKKERVYRAAELLENSQLPLPDVWETCGFGSAESFRRDFRTIIGVPPTKYRQRFRLRTH